MNIIWLKIKNELERGKTLLQFGTLQTFGYIFTGIASLIAAKFLSKDLFGRYSLSETIIFFFLALLITPTQDPFIIYANRERTENGKINKTFTSQATFLLIGILLFLTTSIILKKHLMIFAKISPIELLFVSLAFLGLALKVFMENLFMALNERIKRALINISFGLSTILCIFVFHLMNWLSIKSIFLAFFISSILVVLIFIRIIDFKFVTPLKLEKRYTTEMFHFTKWAALGIASTYFLRLGNTLVLRCFVPMEDIGIYALACKFFTGFTMLVQIIPVYFLPFISENINNPEKIKSYLLNKRPKIFFMGIIALIFSLQIIPHFFNLIYQDKFKESVFILKILLVAIIFILHANLYSPVILALKKYKFPQIAMIIGSVVNITLNIIFIPRFGIRGAAMAAVFSYALLALLYELYFKIRVNKYLGLGA